MRKQFGILLLFIIAIFITACTNNEEVAIEETEEKTETSYAISELVDKSCMSCHAVDDQGNLERISYVRKTPEGWLGTIQRMERLHGVTLTDEERKQIIKDLTNEQGLAPEEAIPVQYWMANKPSYSEPEWENESVNSSCITCHAGGRFEAQRRTEEEWKNLKDFHLVMFPSIYLNHRHMDWPTEADKALEYLTREYLLEQEEWKDWKGKSYDVEGKWKVVGFQATKGFYIGESEFTKEDDGYLENKQTQFLDLDEIIKQSAAVDMYGGFMLRSQYTDEKGEKRRGTYNVVKGGDVIEGDWSSVADMGISGTESYYKIQTDVPEVIHINTQAFMKGETTEVQLYGMNLTKLTKDSFALPEGVSIENLSMQSDDIASVTVKVDESTEIGTHPIELVEGEFHRNISVYENIDYIKIDPPYGVARVGDRGPMSKVSTQFTAYAFSNGADGEKDTEDDFVLMPIEAKWSLGAYPEGRDDEYIKFVGSIDDNGLFTPLGEGVIEEREFTQENVGAVIVYAEVEVDGQVYNAQTHHISTVPDYVNNVH